MKHWVKMDIIKEYRLHDKDTASVDVEIGILTERIRELEEGFQRFGDAEIRLRLIIAIGQRRKLFSYLQNTSPDRYQIVRKKIDRHLSLCK